MNIENNKEIQEEVINTAKHIGNISIGCLNTLCERVYKKSKEETIEKIKNLFDEYNEIDNNEAQFELRIKNINEFLNKINQI
jgi:hypothetical protein